MVSDIARQRWSETNRMRHQAEELLQQLLAERQSSEHRLAELGKRDLIKSVTGRSSLDSAIDQTRQLIRTMDEQMTQMKREIGAGAQIEVSAAHSTRRLAGAGTR